MRALADENFPRGAVLDLRQLGWNILTVQEWRASALDNDVVAKAREDGRIWLTLDKDFGEICAANPPIAPHGVVLSRLPNLSAKDMATRIVGALTVRDDWAGAFSVVDGDRIRFKRTPSTQLGPRRGEGRSNATRFALFSETGAGARGAPRQIHANSQQVIATYCYLTKRQKNHPWRGSRENKAQSRKTLI